MARHRSITRRSPISLPRARHGRRVEVVADPALSGWEGWRAPEVRPDPGAFPTQCCRHVFPGGCTAGLVCHGAPAAAAARILADGMLLPATAVTGRSARDLAAASTWGEPADYFEHVMLANGRCTAPEAVACSRMLGRDLDPVRPEARLSPGGAFLLRLAGPGGPARRTVRRRAPGEDPGRPAARRCAYRLVAPASQRNLITASAGRFLDRVTFVDIDRPRPQDWAVAAFTAAQQLT